MNKVIIIGGGFAGLSAARRLAKRKKELEIVLIDKKELFDFLPVLPDCIGRRIKPEFLSYNIANLSKKLAIGFLKEEVVSLNPEKREVKTLNSTLDYDYLIIASGSETNFYGNENLAQSAYKLDDTSDVKKITQVLYSSDFDTYIIAGGGYTGVEVAANLRLFLKKTGRFNRIIIVERAPSILGPVPDWMKDFVSVNLRRLNVEVMANTAIEKIEGDEVYIAGQKTFNKAMVIWTAGVKAAKFIQDLNVQKNPQGRIRVDEFLRLSDRVFAAGDTANFSYKKIFLRMAVQFSIMEGDCAAVNIIRSIKGLRLKKYKPIDFGYIIPMANNISCGTVLGFNLKGMLATLLHFFMCVWRSCGLKNKFGISKSYFA